MKQSLEDTTKVDLALTFKVVDVKAVKEMDFLAAAKFRDEMLQLQIEIEKMQ